MEKVNELLKKEITLDLIKKSFKKYIIEIMLSINILFILIGSYMFMKNIITYKYFAICEIILMFFNILTIMFFLTKNKLKIENKKIYICMFLVFLCGVISTLFAKSPRVAILGYDNRYEGLLAITYYLSLMLLATLIRKENKKILLNLIIVTGIIEAVYGILQSYRLPFIYDPRPGVTQGFITNQNFYGTYILMCIALSLGLYIEENITRKKFFYVIESFILVVSLFMCNTMSVVVGLFFVTVFIAFYCIKKKKIKQLITTLIIIISAGVITVQSGKTNLIKEITKTTNETISIVEGDINDKFGSRRLFIWKNTIGIIPKYLIKRCRN